MSQSYEEYLKENGIDKNKPAKIQWSDCDRGFVILEQLLILQSVNTVVRYCFHI